MIDTLADGRQDFHQEALLYFALARKGYRHALDQAEVEQWQRRVRQRLRSVPGLRADNEVEPDTDEPRQTTGERMLTVVPRDVTSDRNSEQTVIPLNQLNRLGYVAIGLLCETAAMAAGGAEVGLRAAQLAVHAWNAFRTES